MSPSKSVARVQTGDQVEILETKDRHHFVKTVDGDQGWILKQYVLFSKPKEAQLKTLRAENEELQKLLADEKKKSQKELEELGQTLATGNDQSILVEKVKELDLLTKKRDALLEENKILKRKIEEKKPQNVSIKESEGKITALKKSQLELKQKVAHLQTALDEARKTGTGKGNIKIDPRIQWLLVGAFILLIGIFVGKFVQGSKKSKLTF